jgi:hypothetical protein
LAEARYEYYSDNIFCCGDKTEYTKDANDNVTLEKHYSWNTQTQAWEPNSDSYTVTYTFDDSNKV